MSTLKRFTVTTGYAASIPVTLTKSGSTFAISAGANVQAAIVTDDRTSILAGPVTLSNSATGADWDNSLIVAEFTAGEISAITETGKVKMEISVDDGEKLPFFVNGDVVAGNIV